MRRLAAPLGAVFLLLTMTPAVRAADGMDTASAQLVQRVELLLERSEADRRRLEGEMFIREHNLRLGYETRIAALERELGEARRGSAVVGEVFPPPATDDQLAAAEQELAELRRQVADYARDLAAAQQSLPAPAAGAAWREENAKLAGELQRVMLTPAWSAEAVGADAENDGVLNVNQAAREQLLVVPGMTEAGADFIVWYRDRVGPFIGVSELRLVPDATPELFGQWRRLLRVE